MSEHTPRFAAAAAPLLVGTLVGSLVAGRLETGLLCLAIAAGTALALGAPWPSRAWRITLAGSVLIGWLLNLYLTPGAPLAGWPAVLSRTPTREGLALGALLGLRLAGAMASLQGLRAAWPGERAADAAARVLAPLQRLRVPVRDLRVLLGLALRFAPLVEREGRRIARIQDLRAGRRPRGFGEWLRRRRAAAVPTMVSALERAEWVALALESRGYRSRPLEAASDARRVSPWGLAGAAVAGVAVFWRG
jgi:energy-coupling factor transporter transmembrane protein EcfT